MLKGYLTVAEAAERVNRSVAAMRALAPRVEGAVKVGKTWLIPEKGLERLELPKRGRPITTGKGLNRKRGPARPAETTS